MTETEKINLGIWSNDDFRKTVLTTSEAGVDSDLPDEVRFIAGVAKLIKKRITRESYKNEPAQLAIFLLKPTLATNHELEVRRAPMLDTGLTELNGRLWFVSPVVVVGKYIELEDCNDDDHFRFITDDLKLGDVPAVIFDPRQDTPEVRFYQNGLNTPEDFLASKVINPDVSLERIFEGINFIYNKHLKTPDAQEKAGKLWKNSRKYRPKKNAEHIIQLYLRVGLSPFFPTCTIRTEQGDVAGRLDLEFEESDRRKFVRHAILELKVLRSFGSTGKSVSEDKNLEWIESGVEQSASYRDERGALAAALCCFDMRKKDTGRECFDKVLPLANDNRVELRVWFIYASSEKYRKATITTAQKPD